MADGAGTMVSGQHPVFFCHRAALVCMHCTCAAGWNHSHVILLEVCRSELTLKR